MKSAMIIIFLCCVPILYFLYREEFIAQWNNIEGTLALSTYYISVLFWAYLTNMRIHFAVTRLINVFKYDHTTWKFWAKLITHTKQVEIISFIENKFTNGLNQIKSKTDNSIEILIDNNFLVNVSAQMIRGENHVFIFTSKITVPIRETKKWAGKITNLIESMESAVTPNSNPEKEYEIDIEYNGKSPYYSYWVKKLPEEFIHNFNLSLNIPNAKGSKIKVNKNHLTISSKSYAKVFELTKDYALLQSPI